MRRLKSLERFIDNEYEWFWNQCLPILVKPTLEEELLECCYDTIDDFWNDSITFEIGAPTGKKQVHTVLYKNLIESLDDFDSKEELEEFLQNERRRILRVLAGSRAYYV